MDDAVVDKICEWYGSEDASYEAFVGACTVVAAGTLVYDMFDAVRASCQRFSPDTLRRIFSEVMRQTDEAVVIERACGGSLFAAICLNSLDTDQLEVCIEYAEHFDWMSAFLLHKQE